MNEQVKTDQTLNILAGGGEMGALMRQLDWSKTPLGPVENWSQSLRTSVSILLASRFPMIIFWGPQLAQLYNDTYCPILGAKHPDAMGQPAQECWPEIWHIIGPMLQGVLATNQATWSDDQLLLINRNGYVEECYFTFSYSPIRDESGEVGGVFCAVTETTGQVLGERRLRTLRELATDTSQAKTVEEVSRIAATSLAGNPDDLPFALVYTIDEAGKQATLAGKVGVEAGLPLPPEHFDLENNDNSCPLARVAQTRQAELVTGLQERSGLLNTPDSPHSALVLPLARSGDEQMRGALVVGLSPYRALDEEYKGFVQLVADSITTALANARAYQEERKRAESLAELDRAKTAFFSNVSHEFRTPLTLMLGPLEEALHSVGQDNPEQQRERLEMFQRNSLRLLKLVNNLLDFSRIEAGRVQASYQPTDLPAYTTELAGVFRSAVEKAGLELIVDCPPLPEEVQVYVDREMWEKIFLNLLSNAFKFTFEGKICVRLRRAGEFIELEVQDTGTGIPAHELPHLFERFHRVRGAKARTFEGSGIGLALVQELVKLHGGTIRVESVLGEGTTFTVALPSGKAHLPPDRIGAVPSPATNAGSKAAYIEEALRWLPESTPFAPDPELSAVEPEKVKTRAVNGYILVADDNADMRDYLQHLLTAGAYEVKAVADGLAALEQVKAKTPALVISDVMMPGLDGFTLLREMRSRPETALIPVILLSARAGEEAIVEGMAAGADDYLVKPFAARELLARVQSNLKLAQIREELLQREHSARLEAEQVREQMFRLLQEAPFFSAILRGPEHVFEFSNDLYSQIIGNKDIIGKPIRSSLNEPAYEPFYQILDEVYRTGVSYIGNETLVPKMVRHAGGEPEDSYLNFIYQATHDADGQVDGILIHGVDLTDQVIARQRADFLARAGRLLAASLDYETTLATVAKLAVPDLADWCIVDILDQQGELRRVAVTHADPTKTEIAGELQRLIPDPAKAHPVNKALESGQPVFQPEVEAHPKEAMFGHPDYFSIAEKMELRSRIIVPVSISGKVLGAISLIYSRPGSRYREADLQFAMQLAERAALAIENARLYQIEHQTNDRLTRLQNVTAALAKVLTAQEVASVIVENGLAALNANGGFVALITGDGKRLEMIQSQGYPQDSVKPFLIRSITEDDPASEAARTGQPVWLESLEDILGHYPHLAEGQARTGNKAIVALPLVIKEQPVGVVGVGFKESRVFSQEDRSFMLALVQQCAQALERTRLYEAQQQAYWQEVFLNGINTLLAQSLDYDQTLQNVTHMLVPGLADYCAIYLLDEVGQERWVASHHFDPEKLKLLYEFQSYHRMADNPKSLARNVILSGKAALVEKIDPEQTARMTPDQRAARLACELATRSLIVVPLMVRNQVTGTITLALTKDGKRAETEHYTGADLTLAEEVARRVAAAIDNARLYRQSQRALETQKELDNLKDLYLSVVSHELRNPLASIKGFGQLMQRALLNQAKASPTGQDRRSEQGRLLRPVENILRQTDRMNNLIKQLLDFSRLQNEKLELDLKPGVNLVELVEQVIEQQQVVGEGKRRFELQTEEKILTGKWDSDRIEQVLTNLISNAVKYSPPDCPVLVGVERRQSEEAGDSQEEALVWVKDEGQGISPEHQAHLFDRFYRVRTRENARVEGLGLGLYISHEIVKQHGGRMWLESETGKGSVFYFSLPLD